MTSPQPPSGGPSGPPPSGPSAARPPIFGQATVGGPGPQAQSPVSGPPYGPPVSGPPAARPGRGVARLAMVVAAVAMLLAFGSFGVAAWALNKADDAVDAVAALPPPPAALPGTAPTADPTAGSEPTGDPGQTEPGPTETSNAPLNPQSVFKLFYEKRTLNVQVTGCDKRDVDLDEPRLDAEGAADISLDACTGGIAKMEFTDGVVAAVGESAMTPNECAEQIQFSAIPSTKEYPMRKGDAYCIQTSLAAANSRGDSQRMVVVTVTGVSADNLVTLQATAFVVPE